jgi:hypothetical protein
MMALTTKGNSSRQTSYAGTHDGDLQGVRVIMYEGIPRRCPVGGHFERKADQSSLGPVLSLPVMSVDHENKILSYRDLVIRYDEQT